ncbi:hypothetical protein ACS386_01215 [Flavobacteriaceae bacterium LMO-SS05]
MKNSIDNLLTGKLLNFFKSVSLVILLLIMGSFFSCSPDDQTNFDSSQVQEANSTYNKDGTTSWEIEIEHLTKKMTRFRNFKVAVAQGWDTDVTGYIPHMGHHYANFELFDGIFDQGNPEALLYVPDENGVMQFVGVEYLIFVNDPNNPGPAPEGFTGSEDVWVFNTDVNAWTLHAWVGLENPDGVFAAFNPLVD